MKVILKSLLLFVLSLLSILVHEGKEPEIIVLSDEIILKNFEDLAEGPFEEPLWGSTVYPSIETTLYADKAGREVVGKVKQGQAMMVLQAYNDVLLVAHENKEVYVFKKGILINLPDIIPSITYVATNSKASELKSSYKDIPGITGEKLYEAYYYNERFDKVMPVVPVLYSTAIKVMQAQSMALQEGNTLVIHEAYRPYVVQEKIVLSLQDLARKDSEVMSGITKEPWSISWFIYVGVSNHQVGYALDMSLAKKDGSLYEMQTPFHELSYRSAVLDTPVTSRSRDAWKDVERNKLMTKGSRLLQSYCVQAGLTPLASEWWHFNDLDAMEAVESLGGQGDFIITEVKSRKVK